MIHYSCDCCKRIIDPHEDLRYVLKMELFTAADLTVGECQEDRDHLQEIQDVLQQVADGEASDRCTESCREFRFDLCPECRARFMKNPLGRDIAKQFDFSQN